MESMMEPNNQTIELLEPEEYRKRHPKKTYTYNEPWRSQLKEHVSGTAGSFGGGFSKFRQDEDPNDICTLYD